AAPSSLRVARATRPSMPPPPHRPAPPVHNPHPTRETAMGGRDRGVTPLSRHAVAASPVRGSGFGVPGSGFGVRAMVAGRAPGPGSHRDEERGVKGSRRVRDAVALAAGLAVVAIIVWLDISSGLWQDLVVLSGLAA